MAKNTFYSMSAEDLHTFGAQAYTVLNANPLIYNIPPGDLTALNAAVTGLASSITVGAAAEATFRSAIEDKHADMRTLVQALSKISPKLYTNSSLSDAQIAATGYQPRDHERTPVVPQTPINLVANPCADATVDIYWGRNGNPYGVIFVVEASADGIAWTQVSSTKRRRIVLTGYTPGVKKSLRVTATTNTSASVPSTSVTIYGTGEEGFLQIAA